MDAYLVYDADCRLCILAKDLAKALDWRRRIRPVPLQDPLGSRLLAAMDERERTRSFHVVFDGGLSSRGAGLVVVLGVLPLGRGIPRLASQMPLIRRMSERLYSLLHRVRYAIHCAT